MLVTFKNIPTFDYQTKVWSKTTFPSQENFASYLKTLIKEPGKYEFDECTKVWNAESTTFIRNKRQYCKYPKRTREFTEYWDAQKERCRKGVIFKNGNKEWYVTREYYMLLNFLPIINKEKNNTETFCDVRDVQYHIALYEKLAEATHHHGIIVKKRQSMSSFYHAAKMINVYWFEKKAIIRNLAGDESYLTGEKGIWNYYNGYRDFLNEHTAWYRSNSPNSDLKWIQRLETFINGKRNFSGRKSVMTGTTFKRSPTAGVGGPAYYNYFEECFGKGTNVLMSNGSIKAIEDITIGEFVMGYDGTPREVINTNHGADQLYQINQTKGNPYIVNSKHILVLEQNCNNKHYTDDGLKLYKTEDLFNLKAQYKKRTTYGIKSRGLSFPEREVSIDPYYLGLWLGDGAKNSTTIVVNYSKDREIKDFIETISKKRGLNLIDSAVSTKCNDIVRNLSLTKISGERNNLKEDFRKYKIFSDKRIPKDYLYNSRDIRLKVLAGLIDTDGSLHKATRSYNFAYDISCTKKDLADDIIFLARSLGFYVTVKIRDKKTNTLNGKDVYSKKFTRITIRGNVRDIPVKVKRKKVPFDWSPTSNPLNTAIDIEKLSVGEYYGITLKADKEEDSWFLLEDFTVVHNCGTFPKLDKTYLYMKPQLESGAITTGFFIGAGSVGELKDCKPLRKFIESPEEYGFMGIENTWVNKDRIPKITGLYIPEQWGMPPFIDVWGNSRVEEALAYLNADYGKKEKEMDAEDYQLHISQHPRYMEEAFAYREVSKWPLRKIEKRMQFLKDTPEIHPMKVELDEDEKGMVTWKMSDKQEVPYPTPKRQEDKEGVALMFAPPDSRYKHYAGVDTIETGKTTTSDSLFSIYIHRGISRVIYTDDEGIERTREEGIKLVFSWTGRFSTLEETNKYGELCMRLYEAMSLVERNKENFINHCIRKGIGTKYLLKEKELPFNKEMDFSKQYSGDEYGIYMDPSRKKQERIESYGIEYLNQELDAIYKKDKNGEYTAEKFKTYTGVEKIDDYWLLEELKHGVDDNTDRKQAWLLSITAAKTFEVQGFISTIRENRKDKPIKKVRPARSLLGGSFRTAITTKNKRLRSLLG